MKYFIKKLLRESLGQNILFKEVSVNEPCDCCQYFDFENIEDKYSGLKHPLYFMIEKRKSHRLNHISPKQYIYKIAHGFGGLSYQDVVDSGAVSKDNVKKYAEAMKSGEKFPIGYYTEGSSMQEGRHRALALMELGCEEMPIVVIKDLSNEYVHDFVEEHKDYSREELDKLFKEIGYHGISSLDWREFRRYVEYRL